MSPTRPDVCRFMGATSLHMLTIAVAATEAASDASVGPASAAGNEPCPNSPTGHSHPTPHSLPVLLWLRFSLFCFAFPAIFFVALASFALAPVSPGPHLLSFDLGMLRCCSCFSLSNRPPTAGSQSRALSPRKSSSAGRAAGARVFLWGSNSVFSCPTILLSPTWLVFTSSAPSSFAVTLIIAPFAGVTQGLASYDVLDALPLLATFAMPLSISRR